MTRMQVKTIGGRTPQYALTITEKGVIYIPKLTYHKYFRGKAHVLMEFDTATREVSLTPSGPRPDAIAITVPTRAYQIRCAELFRQMGLKPAKRIHVRALTRKGKRLTFILPRRAFSAGSAKGNGGTA